MRLDDGGNVIHELNGMTHIELYDHLSCEVRLSGANGSRKFTRGKIVKCWGSGCYPDDLMQEARTFSRSSAVMTKS